MNYINNLRKENKKLIMEFHSLDLKTDAGRLRRDKLAKQIRENTQDIQAFAAALGSQDDQSRLFKYKKR